ncbi:unnamed protein product, partial [Rotaria socialis]
GMCLQINQCEYYSWLIQVFFCLHLRMILIDPTLLTNDQEEHIYQELNQTNHEMTPLPTNTVNNSASKMYPLVPINCQPLKESLKSIKLNR